MLPTIGGSDDVRGFEDFRFRDRNAVVLNAEYRWEAFSGWTLPSSPTPGRSPPGLAT